MIILISTTNTRIYLYQFYRFGVYLLGCKHMLLMYANTLNFRKPRLNAELVAAQVAQVVPPKVKKAEKKDRDRKGDGRNLQKGR